METNDNGSAERVRCYDAEQRKRGLVRVSIWVPAGDVKQLKLMAAGLRADAKLLLPTDGQPAPAQPVVPKLEDEQHRPHPGWAYVQADQEEKWLHILLKANHGIWDSKKSVWRIPANLVHRLGLEPRVA